MSFLNGASLFFINPFFKCFVVCASWYNRANKNHLNAQLILSIFWQPRHVLVLSMAHHQEVQPYVYNNWYLLFFLDGCLLSWLDWNQSNQDNRRWFEKNNKYQLLYYIQLYLLMMGLDTPGTCGVWWNILRISCASSWFFFTRLELAMSVQRVIVYLV